MTAVILAGGKGNRIGENKALLQIGRKPLIKLVFERIKGLFNEIIIVGDLVPEKILPRLRHIKDIANWGPLGGIYTGLVNSKSDYCFVFACDMPFINPDLVSYMMERCRVYHVTLPKTKAILHPLHAIYSKSCLPFIERQIHEGNFKICDLLTGLRVRLIVDSEIEKIEGADLSLFDIDTREDLKQAIMISNFGLHLVQKTDE